MIRFPFTSLQQLNLDWIMEQLHKMLKFMPMDGVSGDVLQRNADGAVWQPIPALSISIHDMTQITEPVAANDELPIYDNSLQGNYKATVSDIMQQAPVQSVNGQSGNPVLTYSDVGAMPAGYTPPVTSVNSKTGAVVLTASDVGALPTGTFIPSDTTDLTNGAGYVTAAGAAAAAPVQSVNNKTGAVVLSASDLSAADVAYEPTYLGNIHSQPKLLIFSASSSFLLVTNGGNTNRQGLYIIFCTSSGSPVITTVSSASQLTLTGATGTLRIEAANDLIATIIPLDDTTRNRITVTNYP